MDIQVISGSCAKITLTKDEAERLDIGFDNFESTNPDAKSFLGYIIMVVEDMGVIKSPKDNISVEIFEQENGNLIIYISSSREYEEIADQSPLYAFCTSNPLELFDFCRSFTGNIKKASTVLKLYQYNSYYYLLFTCSIHEQQLKRRLYPFNFIVMNPVIAAKIEEYGRLLCDTPLKKLNIII